MTFSKLPPLLCALAVGAASFVARAEDNSAQAAARIALAKDLFAMSAQQATNAPATDTNPAMHPVNDKQAAKEGKAKAKADKAAADAKAKQEAADAKAAAALAKADQKAKEEADKKLMAQQAADAKAAAAQSQAQAKADQAAKSAADQKSDAEKAALTAAVTTQVNADAQAKSTTQAASNSMASATMPEPQAAAPVKEDKKAKSKKEKPAPATATTASQPAATIDTSNPGADLGMKPIAAPAIPISATKQDRLQALLDKYKADQITPEEYHQQRATILLSRNPAEAVFASLHIWVAVVTVRLLPAVVARATRPFDSMKHTGKSLCH